MTGRVILYGQRLQPLWHLIYLITLNFGDTLVILKNPYLGPLSLSNFCKFWNIGHLKLKLRNSRADYFPHILCQAFHFTRIPQLLITMETAESRRESKI